ncbi:hypothetical protein BJ122_102204 [Rhodopseudomonas faecalis]|uniref:ASCH domain-containing protein n=1 Tax=Rhodopseudomonas faecalis TaxID=99655 RepID=A0A318TPP6_9BRAD|nr:hypothetical protein [Rhodopseudomonas faecalis]PYF04978.1 hypothetical protein BJ122_102204 [Rhodopseudomonas faecalis]
MADRSIRFPAPMILAALDGRKTQARQLAWGKNNRQRGVLTDPKDCFEKPTPWQALKPGDRLWVKEAFAQVGTVDPPWLVTKADYPECAKIYGFDCIPETIEEVGYRWRPSIHMPRWASRLTLIVTGVQIERLQDISEADAVAEGCRGTLGANSEFPDEWDPSPAEEFRDLWSSLYGPEAWAANPEVVAITFRTIRANIDSQEAK